MRKVFQENGCTDSRCDSGSVNKAASSILRAASKGEKACFSELGHMPGKESEVYDAEPTSLFGIGFS